MSVLEQNSLDEFVSLAQLSKKQFEAERGAVVVSGTTLIPQSANSIQNQAAFVSNFIEGDAAPKFTPLKIPRRPGWNKTMTAHEIESQENVAFLEWRRDIASMEQDNVQLAITPFEKNIEIWRQLWRVIEKSDLLLQIVDGRNPYFFYSADLEKYITECGQDKQFILLINKADYLSDELRQHWNNYFKEKGVTHLFFSALEEQEKIDAVDEEPIVEEEDEDDQSSDDDDDESSDEDKDEAKAAGQEEVKDEKPEETVGEATGTFTHEFNQRMEKEELAEQRKKKPLDDSADLEDQEPLEFDTMKVFTRGELLRLLKEKSRSTAEKKGADDRLIVGTVGYPNVGKSSVINVLMGMKKVGVASLPGKTKHF